jgi:hypothetical protein
MRMTWNFLTLFLLFLLPAMSLASPMVEKRLFRRQRDRENLAKRSRKSRLVSELERKLRFTGVIISPRGKWAMIKEWVRKSQPGDTRLSRPPYHPSTGALKRAGERQR